jgi:hypothetical protein
MVEYEWTAERVDGYGDIQASFFGASLAELAQEVGDLREYDVALVRDVSELDGNREPVLVGRSWAYVTGDELPATTSEGDRVPSRFAAEWGHRT